MDKKIVYLSERKKRVRTAEEAADWAVKKFFTTELLALKEPVAFTIGKTNAQGGFVPDTDIDEVDCDDEKQ